MHSIKAITYSIINKIENVMAFEGEALLRGTELEYLLADVSSRELEELYMGASVVWKRYEWIQNIFEGNIYAKNVFDLALAEYICPAFMERLEKKRGMGGCIFQGFVAEGNYEPSYRELYEVKEKLDDLMKSENMQTAFYDKSYHMDDRLFGFLNGDDRLPSCLQKFVSYIEPQMVSDEICGMEETVAQVEKQMEQNIAENG